VYAAATEGLSAADRAAFDGSLARRPTAAPRALGRGRRALAAVPDLPDGRGAPERLDAIRGFGGDVVVDEA
jgi:hypothetical protein